MIYLTAPIYFKDVGAELREQARPGSRVSPAYVETALTEDLLTISAIWAFAIEQPDGSTLPQIIAHRGYKAIYPENSMAAFRAAVEAGVHCIETDVHVTRDDVVVLSHVSRQWSLKTAQAITSGECRMQIFDAASEKTSVSSIITGWKWRLCVHCAHRMSRCHD